MATDNVTPIKVDHDEAAPLNDRLLLTECPEETAHRVACILRFLACHPEDPAHAYNDDDSRFGGFILLRDLAAALDYAAELTADDAAYHAALRGAQS